MRSVFLSLLLVNSLPGDTASRFHRDARRAERKGDDLQAYALLTRALAIHPQNKKYQREAERLRPRAALSLAALDRLKDAAALDPSNTYLSSELRARDGEEQPGEPAAEGQFPELEQAAEPVELKPQPGARNFRVRGDVHSAFEQVFRAYGLEAVFDSDLPGGGQPFRFELDGVDFPGAARALLAVTGTFLVPIHERVALIAKDTQQKRVELDPMEVARLPIPQATTAEEANEIGRSVQQALDIKRLSVDAVRRQVLVRDTVAKVRLARALYQQLSRSRGEVMLDIELLSVSRSTLTNFGLTLPTSFSVANAALGAVNLGGGHTLFGIQIAGANFEASLTRSDARLLSSFRLRATDGLPASLHVGDRYPIANAIFSPIVITDQIRDLQNRGQLRAPFPSFTFEDLGLVLKVTPRVHDRDEVSLTIEADFRLLTGVSLNSLPVISERKFNSAVRLKQGEMSLVSGLATVQKTRTSTGLPGLSQIPLLGRLFSRSSWQTDQNELLLAITPHVTVLPPGEQVIQRAYYYGTDTHPVSPL